MKLFRTDTILAIAIAAFAVSSCSVKPELITISSARTFDCFTASIEGSETKALIDSQGAVNWQEGDCILIFSDTQKDGVVYTWDGKGAFRGEPISGNTFYAFYPFLSWTDMEGQFVKRRDSESLILKSMPITLYGDRSFMLPMVAKSTDNRLNFKQTFAMLHFTITGKGKYNQLRVSSNGQERVWGHGEIDLGADTPVFSLEEMINFSSRLRQNVYLDFDQQEKGEFFFGIPECVLENGFTFELLDFDSDGIKAHLTKSTTKRLEFQRAHMYNYVVDTSEMAQEEVYDQRAALAAFYQATGGDNWFNNTNWCTDAPLNEWYGLMVERGMVWQIDLQNNNLTGTLTPELAKLNDLTVMALSHNQIGGSLPSELAEMRNLEYLGLYSNRIEGEIPANYPGFIKEMWLGDNRLYGEIPAFFLEDPYWNSGNWSRILEKNLYSLETYHVYPEPFSDVFLDGTSFEVREECAKNTYTAFFNWWSGCPAALYYLSVLKEAYEVYKDKGFEIISCNYGDEDNTDAIRSCIEEYKIPWRTYVAYSGQGREHHIFSCPEYPSMQILDSSGRMVFCSSVNDDCYKIKEWLEEHLGDNPQQEKYYSTDFSRDGKVNVLQSATEGKGIDLVFMGDAYSDRQIANGEYAADVNRAVEAFFSVEPYRSFRNMFNVYEVEVVSLNEGYKSGNETALNGWFKGSDLGGNSSAIFNYASAAVPGSKEETTMVVLMNRDYYAGVCQMFYVEHGDYGTGSAIAYVPVAQAESQLTHLVCHEAGGHGFAKLDDEYTRDNNFYITQAFINERRMMEPYGWWKNVDFTSDPTAVKWAQFITDERYANEQIGVYEGASTFWYGAWRPTDDSIMNIDTTHMYNAPSRYAIWYRINKLAYGPEWNGTYEDFVTYDAVNRTPEANAARRSARRNSVEKGFAPLAPPVVVRGGWNQAK